MRRIWFVVQFGLLLLLVSRYAWAQVDDVLCRDGAGSFDGEFQGNERVHVGAARSGGLATRTCEAVLRHADQTVVVASGASEIDLDAFGADLGAGNPVAAFQVKKSDSECCRSYQIYSLQKEPHLLRTLTGGSYFRSADVDLDGRVEVWTDDAAVVSHFENLSLGELDFAPPVVLRFERNQLLDVSSEFQSCFDERIAQQRARLDAQALKDFKSSDGKLLPSVSAPPESLHRLRRTKIAILEIIWSYLYSGREQQAWNSVADLWPEQDADRIRGEIVSARNRGIRSQIDGTEKELPNRKRRTEIYDVTTTKPDSGLIPPQGIMLRQPPDTYDDSLKPGETYLDLVIDSAGKVRSVKLSGSEKSNHRDLIEAAMEWTFIPALRSGRAVASKTRLAISARR